MNASRIARTLYRDDAHDFVRNLDAVRRYNRSAFWRARARLGWALVAVGSAVGAVATLLSVL